MSIPLLSQLSDLAPIGIAVVVAAAVWFFLLRVRPTKLKSADDVKNVIGGGKPVVLEFFSNM